MLAAAIAGLAAAAALYAQPSKSVWDGVYTEEQEQRGFEVYQQERRASPTVPSKRIGTN